MAPVQAQVRKQAAAPSSANNLFIGFDRQKGCPGTLPAGASFYKLINYLFFKKSGIWISFF
jgi:hypothetical protein